CRQGGDLAEEEAMVILAVLAVVVVAVIAIYNGLVRLRAQADNAWADIDVQLKRRYDLVPNLVETVKGYAGHERSTLEAVVSARSRAMTAVGPVAKAGAGVHRARTGVAAGGSPAPGPARTAEESSVLARRRRGQRHGVRAIHRTPHERFRLRPGTRSRVGL